MPPACAPRRVHAFARLAAAALLAHAIAARAGEAVPAGTDARLDAGTIEGPTIEVVADRPLGAAKAAQTTVVEVAKFAGEVRSVAELASTSPGVSLHALGGPGQQTTLSLRGASADESMVLLDGIPLQGPAGGAVDLATVPASLLDRLVIERGVLGAQLGAGALGGVVELVPRAAPQGHPQGGASLSFGSFSTAQLAADVGLPVASGSAVAAVQLDTTQGDYSYATLTNPEVSDAVYLRDRMNDVSRRASGLLRYAGAVTPSLELDVLAQASGGMRGLPGPIGNPTQHARANDLGGLFGSRLRGRAGDAVWSVRGWGRADRLTLHGVRSYDDCIEGTDPSCDPLGQRSESARGEGEVSLAPLPHQWLTARAGAGEDWAQGTHSGAHRRAVAFVALADDVLLLQGRLALHPALRLDQVGAVTGLSPGLGVVATPFAAASASSAQSVLAPLELRASAGRSFRAPGFSELYLDQGPIAPNPDLAPERAVSFDAGVAWRTDSVTLSLGGFWSRYQNLILYEQFPPGRVTPMNLGAARIAGLELQAVVPLPLGFVVEAAYSYLSAIDERNSPTEQGRALAYRPPHRLFLRGARRGDRVEGFAELNATSAMPRNQYSDAKLPAQLVINVGAGLRIAGPLWLDVEVKNALDDRTLQDLFQYPLPGLSVAAVARIRL